MCNHTCILPSNLPSAASFSYFLLGAFSPFVVFSLIFDPAVPVSPPLQPGSPSFCHWLSINQSVTCGIFHHLAPGAPCCLRLCIVLLFFPVLPSLSLSLSHTHAHSFSPRGIILSQPVASYGLLFVVNPAVWGSSSCQ